MKENVRKKCLRNTGKLLETKICSGNIIIEINTWLVPLIRYSGPFFEWTREEISQTDQRTGKINNNAQSFTPERWHRQVECVKKRKRRMENR